MADENHMIDSLVVPNTTRSVTDVVPFSGRTSDSDLNHRVRGLALETWSTK